MPESLINIIGKMKTREIQLCVGILAVCFLSGGTGWSALSDRMKRIEDQQTQQEIMRAKLETEIKSISQKIDIIHNHVVKRGLEASRTPIYNDPAVRAN